MNIMQLAADLAQRVPEMAKDSTANNAELIARMIEESENVPEIGQRMLWVPVSLRDWLAGMAMQALIAAGRNGSPVDSYNWADSMLEERKKHDRN